MHTRYREHSQSHSLFGRLARIGLTGALLASSVMTVLAPATRAQSDALLSTSSVVPANVAIYAEMSLDTESIQFQNLDALLARLGSEDSLIQAIEDAAADASGGVNLNGAEIAIAVLPSVLSANADVGGIVDEVGSVSSVADAEDLAGDVNVGAESEGVVVVIRPTEIDALETEIRSETGVDAPTEEYLGVEIIEGVDDGGMPSFFAIVDDFMLVGSYSDDLKLFIDASLDGGSSLAGLDQFEAASNMLPGSRFAFAFANGPVIFDEVNSTLDDATLNGIVDVAFTSYTGYSGITISAEEAGLRIETVTIPIEPEVVDSSGSADLTMADRMPIDTVVFANGFDLGQTTLLKSVGLLLVAALGTISSDSMEGDSVATPEPISVDEMYNFLAQLLGFNIKTDFIDQMTGEYGFGVWGIESGGIGRCRGGPGLRRGRLRIAWRYRRQSFFPDTGSWAR